MSQTFKYILLTAFLLWPSYYLASSKDQPLVHIDPKQTYSQSFGAEQNTKISNWLKDKVEPALGIPEKESWFPDNRAGNYSNVKFFNGKAGDLNMRHLGNVKHDKSGRVLSVLLVRPDDNQKLPTITRPIKPFIILASDQAVKAGPAPKNNSKTTKQVATKKVEKTTGYPGLECIKGDCMNGKGTLKVPNKPIVIHGQFKRGKFHGDVKLVSDEKPPYVYEGGFSPDSLTFYGQGTLHNKELNTVLSSSFYRGIPQNRARVLYKNVNYEVSGDLEKKGKTYIPFQGTVKGKILTSKTDAKLLKNLITEGEYKSGVPVGKHVIKFCGVCKPFYEVSYDENGKPDKTTLYTDTGPVQELVKQIKADARLLKQGVANLKKQAKQFNMPMLKETDFFCNHQCRMSYNSYYFVHTDDIRIFLTTPRTEAKFTVKFGSLASKECVVKDGYCSVLYKAKGEQTYNSMTIEGVSSKYPYPVAVMVAGHEVKQAPKPQPKSTSDYVSEGDVKAIVAKIMKGTSYTTLWTQRIPLSGTDEMNLFQDGTFSGKALQGGKYRMFIWSPDNDEICMQWETLKFNAGPSNIQTSTKGCSSRKLTKGRVSMSGYIVPDGAAYNNVTLTGGNYLTQYVIVFIKQY